VARPSAVVTVRVSGSTPLASTCLTWMRASLRNRVRSGVAMSLGASAAVATWYSSGWNW
jgi:hypothetical protein